MDVVKRGQVWLVRLDPTEGSEIRKTRPCLVVSPPELAHHRVQTVLPMTTGGYEAPFRIRVKFQGRDGFILPDQVRTVSRVRMLRHLEDMDTATLRTTLAVLREMFEE